MVSVKTRKLRHRVYKRTSEFDPCVALKVFYNFIDVNVRGCSPRYPEMFERA